jgi:hypothetical protein
MSADMKSPPGGDAEGAKVAEQNASRSDCGHRNSLPAPWSWLSTDRPELARQEFVFQVLFADLDDDELVDCCELFRLRWGTAALIAALQCAHRQAPLPDAARQLLAAYMAGAA